MFASVGSFVDAGSLSIYAATAPDRLDELQAVVNEQLADLAANGPDDDELEVARRGFEGATVLGLEDTGSRMARLASNLLVRDRVVSVDEHLEGVRSVDADAVGRVFASVVDGPSTTSIVTPG